MKKDFKYAMLFLFLGILIVLSTFLTSAVLITPASSATLSQNVNMNATNTSLPNMLNCSFFAWSSLSANTSQSIVLKTASNLTANAPMINVTFNTTGLEDANDYSFSARCYNSTANVNATNTGITIDNTDPTTPTLTSPTTDTSITSSTTQTFTCGVTGSKTTACTIFFGINGAYSASSADSSSAAMTHSGSTCTYSKTFSTQSDNGNWYWSCEASDGTDVAGSSNNILSVQIPGNQGGGNNANGNKPSPLSIGANTTPGNANWGIVALIIIGIVSLYFFFKRK